jgi:cysteinyl-tRNA synthetase
MDDDFNTPKAIASLFVLMNECKNMDLSDDDKIAIKVFLNDVSQILGVDFYLEETSAGSDDLFNLITNVRTDLRAAKQYELSDKIRDELINLGYEIND